MPLKFGPFALIRVVCDSSSFQRHFDITSTVFNTVPPVVHTMGVLGCEGKWSEEKWCCTNHFFPITFCSRLVLTLNNHQPNKPSHYHIPQFTPFHTSSAPQEFLSSPASAPSRGGYRPPPPAGTAITRRSHQTRTRQQPYAPLYYPPQKKKKKGTNTLQTVIKSHLRKQTYKPTSKQANKTIRYPKDKYYLSQIRVWETL